MKGEVRTRVRRSNSRYVLMKPCWGAVDVLIINVCWINGLFGPIFSVHERSMAWVEMVWAQDRVSVGRSRWRVDG